jgi:HIV Tat-specific factor 1
VCLKIIKSKTQQTKAAIRCTPISKTVSIPSELFAGGYITDATYLWAEGRAEWSPLSAIPELHSALSSSAAQSGGGSQAASAGGGPKPAEATPPDVDEELEKWKREVEAAEEEVKRKKKGYVEKEKSPEAPVTGGDPERPSTPPEGEREFTDDDGTVYAWDDKRRAWVPKEGLKEYNPEEMVFVPEEEVIPSLPPPADPEKEGDSPDEEAPQKVWRCLNVHVFQLLQPLWQSSRSSFI